MSTELLPQHCGSADFSPVDCICYVLTLQQKQLRDQLLTRSLKPWYFNPSVRQPIAKLHRYGNRQYLQGPLPSSLSS